MHTLLIVGTKVARGDRLSGCPTTNNLLMNATSNIFMLQIPNISYTSAGSCISYSLNSSFSSLFQCSRHSPLPHTRYDLRPSMILHHIFTLTVTLSLSASCRLRVNIAKQNLNIVVSSIQPYLNRCQLRYPHIFLYPILRLLWATMVPRKSSPYSSGYTTHLGTSTNVPQCCDIIGGFAYFKLFKQGTGSYKYPQLVAHRSVVCGYLCSSSQDRPTLYLSDNQLHLPKTICAKFCPKRKFSFLRMI